jgi:hypothetical protein
VSDCSSAGGRHRRQRPDLIHDNVLDFLKGQTHGSPAEACEIGEARVRANRQAAVASELHGTSHDMRVTCVEAAGDVDRGDMRHQLGVVTEQLTAKIYADVGIQIDGH